MDKKINEPNIPYDNPYSTNDIPVPYVQNPSVPYDPNQMAVDETEQNNFQSEYSEPEVPYDSSIDMNGNGTEGMRGRQELDFVGPTNPDDVLGIKEDSGKDEESNIEEETGDGDDLDVNFISDAGKEKKPKRELSTFTTRSCFIFVYMILPGVFVIWGGILALQTLSEGVSNYSGCSINNMNVFCNILFYCYLLELVAFSLFFCKAVTECLWCVRDPTDYKYNERLVFRKNGICDILASLFLKVVIIGLIITVLFIAAYGMVEYKACENIPLEASDFEKNIIHKYYTYFFISVILLACLFVFAVCFSICRYIFCIYPELRRHGRRKRVTFFDIFFSVIVD